MSIVSKTHFFFVGIAGTGMSAIAQYLHGIGKTVAGSDREFGKQENKTEQQFSNLGMHCFPQDGSGVTAQTEVVVVSTAIEESNIEYRKAVELGIPVVKRSALLAEICNSKKTIAVGGTSGKSTTTAMIFHILQQCGADPSLITGAGLSSLQEKGLIGNAWVGKSEWLVIEADESDGSIIGYKPEIGVLLNIDRDHKEFSELIDLFSQFKKNTTSRFIVNQDFELTRALSDDKTQDFGTKGTGAGFIGTGFEQTGFSISFAVLDTDVKIPVIGKHNMENALAAIATCNALGVSIKDSAHALTTYRGIFRRTQHVATANGIIIIDDFAHNPAEVAAAIKSCKNISPRVWAWFQPHGFGPLRFMHQELSEQLIETLREQDTALLSSVYYAGGTVDKDIDSGIVTDVVSKKKNAHFFPSRDDIIPFLKSNAKYGDVILLMGARDPYLAQFAKSVAQAITGL